MTTLRKTLGYWPLAMFCTVLGAIVWFGPLRMTGTVGPMPVVGAKYIPSWDYDPFATIETNTVIEVRGRWVLYENQFRNRYTARLTTFRSMYKKVSNPPTLLEQQL